MPSRNVLKLDIADTYYHVYARGANKSSVFIEETDKMFFLSLFERYLSKDKVKNRLGEAYPNYRNQVALLAYCLMPNHFHLLIHQNDQGTMAQFMKSLLTSYSRYFNRKYKRTGPLFESRYKANNIDTDAYLHHISRYIHMNPRYWLRYEYSSLRFYLKPQESPVWLQPQPIIKLFKNPNDYLEFLKSYNDEKDILKEVKHNLAD